MKGAVLDLILLKIIFLTLTGNWLSKKSEQLLKYLKYDHGP